MRQIMTFVALLLLVSSAYAQANKKGSATTGAKKDAPAKTVKKSKFNFCPDNKHPHAIDLDLPSGTLWSCCNVGADIPEESGGFYAYAELKEKKSYSYMTYKYHEGSDSDRGYTKWFTEGICGTEYDVAHVLWGEGWQIPSAPQIDELIRHCIYEYVTIDSISGGKFIGPNGNMIFIPAAGYRDSTPEPKLVGQGFCPSGTSPDANPLVGAMGEFYFDTSGCFLDTKRGRKYTGYTVRPVFDER